VKAVSLCVAVLAAAALAAAVEPARACSCIPPDPWTFLKQADGAFVGRLVSRREGGQGRAILTFSVERAVKGKIGATVEVETPSSGAACGIETSVGRRIGLFLEREGGKWLGNLCSQVEPEDLLAAASLPAPNGKGPVALFVGGRFGPARTLALDSKGRTLAYGLGAGYVVEFSVCPGGRRVAEFVGNTPYGAVTVAIRDLPTLRLIRQQPLNRYYSEADALHCANANGEQIVGFYGSGPGLERPARLVRITSKSTATIWQGRAWYASFTERSAYVQVLPGYFRPMMVAVDLRTSIAKKLGPVSVVGANELTPNRAGTRLAGDSFEEGCRGASCSKLLAIDLERRPISTRTIPVPNEFGSTLWLSDNRFAYLREDKIRVYTSLLRLVTRVSGWNAGSTAALGSRLFGVDRFGKLFLVQLSSGKIGVVRRLPGESYVIVSATG